MTNEEKYSKTLRVRIDEDLLERIIEEAEKLNTDISSYVRWCIRTGLYLEDLSMFLQSRIKENH
jgi:predicted HicB family RNase H-like nuclease